MAAQKTAKEVRDANKQAHQAKLAQELTSTNENLSVAVSELQLTKKQLTQLEAEILKAKNELSKVTESVSNELRKLEVREQKSEKKTIEAAAKLEALTAEHKEKVIEQRGELLSLKAEIADLTVRKIDIIEDFGKWSNEMAELKNLVEKEKLALQMVVKKRDSLFREIAQAESKLAGVNEQLQKEMKAAMASLAEVHKTIEEEKEKVSKPRALLAQSEAEFERKKRNFDILLNRMQKVHQKMYPGQILRI